MNLTVRQLLAVAAIICLVAALAFSGAASWLVLAAILFLAIALLAADAR